RFSDVLLELGPAGLTELTYWLRIAMADWSWQRAEPVLVTDSRIALVLEDWPRNEGVSIAREILAAVKRWSREQFPLGCPLTLSSGLATLEHAPKNLAVEQFTEI